MVNFDEIKIDETFLKSLTSDVPYSSEEKKDKVLKKLKILSYKFSVTWTAQYSVYHINDVIKFLEKRISNDNVSITKFGISFLNKCDDELSKYHRDKIDNNEEYTNLMMIVNQIIESITESLGEADGNK